ncbi:MAG TPA: DUF503 domain-containing protein [Nitriliruptorales bacterium]
MEQPRVFFGVGYVDLQVPESTSLKAKRAVLNRIKARLANELAVSVTEVGYQDTWQRAGLGVAVACSTEAGVDRVLDRIVAVIERDPRVIVLDHHAIIDHLEG